MAVTGSPFCEHKKLRTSCAPCKAAQAASLPQKPMSTYVSRDERDEAAQKRAANPKAAAKPGGPGRPLLPKRTRQNTRVTADEAAHATAWWVKK
ncbi:MAG: hypothetical protein WDA16_06780 [Candidatus Thermoplasmatota archaeon]